MDNRNLPKHMSHRTIMDGGFIDIHHLIAKNAYIIDLCNQNQDRLSLSSLSRDDLRNLRDSITKALME